MFLHSLIYFITLPLLVCIYYLLPVQKRVSFLLLISLAWIGAYNFSSLAVLLALTVLNYSIVLKIPLRPAGRNVLYYFAQFLNVVSLLFLNKVAFYNDWTELNVWNHFSMEAALFALGINYYGLQQIGYLIDVHKKRTPPETDFTKYVLFTSLVFKISAGPILRYGEYKNSFLGASASTYKEENIASGIHRILLGVFKKTVLADRLAPIAADIYDLPANHLPAASTWLGAAVFFVQLYFDFSGYIDIALGSARLFGITLKENFNLPLRATSVSDFWRRWHISLMDWLGHYVFFPVMFRLKKQPRFGAGVAIAVTFLISGLWHGVGITFLVYACLHIIYMLVEFYTASWRKKYLPAAGSSHFFRWGYAVFVFMLISLSLVFFRSGTMDNAVRIITHMFDVSFIFDNKIGWRQWLINGGADYEIVFNHRISICLAVIYLLLEKSTFSFLNAKKLNMWFVVVVSALIVLFGTFGNSQRFIYLQF